MTKDIPISQCGAFQCGSRGNARRRAILEAAWCVFLEKGFERTTLGDIIARSGGSRSTLYEGFRDKEGLFEAVITWRCEEFINRLQGVTLNDTHPEKALTDFGIKFASEVMSAESQKFIRLMISGGDLFPDVVDRFLNRAPNKVRDILADYLKEASALGQLNVTDPEGSATVFLGFLHGEGYLRMLLRPNDLMNDDEIKQHVDRAVQIFLKGVIKV